MKQAQAKQSEAQKLKAAQFSKHLAHGVKEGLPLGLQLIGRAFDEGTMLRVAHVLESAAAFKLAPGDWWRRGA